MTDLMDRIRQARFYAVAFSRIVRGDTDSDEMAECADKLEA